MCFVRAHTARQHAESPSKLRTTESGLDDAQIVRRSHLKISRTASQRGTSSQIQQKGGG